MKLFGHPLHVMLIHFPSALFPMDLVCAVLACCTGNHSFTDASFYALIGGTLLGWAAVAAGTFDLLLVMKNKPAAMRKALIHGGINSAVLCGFSVLAFMAYRHYPGLAPDDLKTMITKGILILIMLAGNFLGGNLVIKEKVLDEKQDNK
jgi:uncharacterized membrane protein